MTVLAPIKIIVEDVSWMETFLAVLGGVAIPLALFYTGLVLQSLGGKIAQWKKDRDNIFYLATNLEFFIERVEKQVTGLKSHGDSIIASPLDFHQIQVLISDKVHFDHEKLFHSYLALRGNSIETIKEFRKILTFVEFFRVAEERELSSQEKYIKELTDRLYRFKDLAEEQLMNYASHVQNEIRIHRGEQDPLYIILNGRAMAYYNAGETHENLYNLYILPLIKDLLNGYRENPVAMEITDRAARARKEFVQLNFRMNFIGKEFLGSYKNYNERMGDLKTALVPLNEANKLPYKKRRFFKLIDDKPKSL